MVSTDGALDEPVAVESFPHRHTPLTYSEPYTEFGVVWVVGICECGVPLSPRRASAVRST